MPGPRSSTGKWWCSADGTTDFSVLQNELKGKSTKTVMVAFDLLYLNGYDLRKLPLIERKRLLKKIIDKTDIQFSESLARWSRSSMLARRALRASSQRYETAATRPVGPTIGQENLCSA
jgi:ATP-dependent DNA ligase